MLSTCDIGNPIYRTTRPQRVPRSGAGSVNATIWIDGDHSLERDIDFIWTEVLHEKGVEVIVVRPADLGTPYLKEDILFAIEESLHEEVIQFDWAA